MKVLYATSEALPFAASGGLADVAGSLPHAMRVRLIGCRVVLPLYESVPQELRDNMTFLTSLSVPVAWRRQYCGVFEARHNGVIYYLLDNQYYFKRPGLYGHYDDAERFAFLSRAILEMLAYIDFKPDIIHANDWQTALVPVYYSLFYAGREGYENIKTVFTIHNIQYQGKYGMEILEDVFGIPQSSRTIVEQDGCVNLMKGAIEMADKVTTVSPTYAQEILDPWFSHGLDTILRAREWKLTGILNGIDTEGYNPETDPLIYKTYSADDPSGKAENKRALQERLNLPAAADVPLIGMVTRLVAHKGLDLVKYVLDELLQENLQVVILGSGDWAYENYFREVAGPLSAEILLLRGLPARAGPEDIRRRGYLPYALQERALRPVSNGGLPVWHGSRRAGNRRLEGQHPRLRRRRGHGLHLQDLQRQRHAVRHPPFARRLCEQNRLAGFDGSLPAHRFQLGPLRQRVYQAVSLPGERGLSGKRMRDGKFPHPFLLYRSPA